MSWLNNLFAGQAPAAQQAPAATQAPANGGQQASPEATAQVQQQTTAATTVSNNPLDLFMQLGQNNGNGQQGQAPQFDIPQDALATVAKQLDYSKAIPQEALQKLQSGDMSALGDILNSALQAQYMTMMQQMPKLTQAYVDNRISHDRQSFQSDVRSQVVENSLNIKDLHPVAQTMFRDTAKKLAAQYPDANPQEIEQQTWQLMETLGGQFNRTAQVQQKAQKASEVNWDEFIGN